jgi:hypothetical protein
MAYIFEPIEPVDVLSVHIVHVLEIVKLALRCSLAKISTHHAELISLPN